MIPSQKGRRSRALRQPLLRLLFSGRAKLCVYASHRRLQASFSDFMASFALRNNYKLLPCILYSLSTITNMPCLVNHRSMRAPRGRAHSADYTS
jgi:hypothetical protein